MMCSIAVFAASIASIEPRSVTVAGGCAERLHTLVVSNCIALTDAGIVHISRCSTLRELNLSTCRQTSDVGLAALASGCTQLTALDLTGCYKVSDAGVRLLIACCPGLQAEALRLEGCYNVTSVRGLRMHLHSSALSASEPDHNVHYDG